MKKLLTHLCTLVLLFSLSTFLASCGGDDPKPKTPEELLRGATRGWVTVSATISPGLPLGGTTITDLFSLTDPCDEDDVVVFTSATAYNVENPQKCEQDEPTIWESGTWSLSSDKTVVRFVPAGDDPHEVRILELTEATWRGSVRETINGISYTITATMQPRR